jgi:hypothetical protein
LPEETEAAQKSPEGTELPPDHYGGGFYGTDITPETLVADGGLLSRGTNWNIIEHAENPPGAARSAYRGTTESPSSPIEGQGAAYWAGEGGYVYEITGVPTWNVARALEGRIYQAGKDRRLLIDRISLSPSLVVFSDNSRVEHEAFNEFTSNINEKRAAK